YRERIPVCPDAYFVLRMLTEPDGRNRIHVFLEAARSTMTLKRMFTKLQGNWHYWRSGLAEKRFGIKNFLVLTVTPTPERASNLCATGAKVDADGRGLRMFLFGDERRYSIAEPAGVLDRVWATAADGSLHSLLE